MIIKGGGGGAVQVIFLYLRILYFSKRGGGVVSIF